MAATETLIAALMASRPAYEQFRRHGDEESLKGLPKQLVTAIGSYYDTDRGIQHCDRDVIRERVERDLPNPKHQAALREYLHGIPEGVSVANVERDIVELKRERLAGELSLALANRSSQDTIDRLIAEYASVGVGYGDTPTDQESELIDPLDTSDLLSEKPQYDYIKLWPKQLNERLDGGALRGHHVLVFARPEAGKTLFAINLVCGFLHQKLNVIYIGNEEPTSDIRDRIRARLLKVSKSEIRSNRPTSAERLGKADFGSIRIAEGTSFQRARACIERGVTDVVILDQIRNMRVKSDSRTSELEAAGIEARAIAKEFGVLVVSITQAGDSATGKVYLEMSDVDSSKTGIPASADLMVGLGADEAMKVNGLMGISLPKNKLSGLHDKFTCTVNYSSGVLV